MDLEELNQQLAKLMEEQNRRAVPEFEGYSPYEMNNILHDTFGTNSPIQLQKLSSEGYDQIPMLQQVKYLGSIIDKSGSLKLTAKGFLPTKIVAELYAQEFIKDDFIDDAHYKLYKETDSNSIHLTRILIELTGIAKKRLGKLSLTKNGQKVLKDDFELFKLLFDTFRNKFNWGYFDGYDERPIGPLGFGFTLILLSKYGEKPRSDIFYAEKYLKAFPALLEGINPGYTTVEDYAASCYSIRTFDRFMDYFGLVALEKEGAIIKRIVNVQKTPLLDKLFKIKAREGGK
ncbi:MAG: hypothetical protein EA341_19210 [Mongoliibacter sp.]|uniref:hypothetical protein n=1 Tax=Mongoliibacter sp. TaxID=2022438 RepID=UPI0012EFB3ED|nr:hypothetical protein [Mongoliibacter sp.]TVP42768.1 MAG: hypothetical protein EA341_19210 [Mongoliibacter sp.]